MCTYFPFKIAKYACIAITTFLELTCNLETFQERSQAQNQSWLSLSSKIRRYFKEITQYSIFLAGII